MSQSSNLLRPAALTLLALAYSYGLWTVSVRVEEWAAPELMPVIRFCVIAVGLSAGEWIHRRLLRA